jgi:Tol biopolymer transport system component
MKSTFGKYSAILTSFIMILSQGSAIATQEQPRKKVDFPHTDIFLFDLDLNEVKLTNGKNVTNRLGYDNQPYFTADSQSFVFSRGDDYQTDVYEYFLASGEIKRVTNSSATEFSPTPVKNNSAIAFVSDRNGSIWIGQRNDVNQAKWLLESADNKEPVGYFAWNTKSDDVFYWSRYGFSMALENLRTNSYHFISGNTPPSTPHIIPNTDKFSFVHRQTNERVWIKELDPKTLAIRPLVMITGSNHNYTWAPDGSILMIQNDVLYRIYPEANQPWQQVAALGEFAIKKANRLDVSPDGNKLAIVGQSSEHK